MVDVERQEVAVALGYIVLASVWMLVSDVIVREVTREVPHMLAWWPFVRDLVLIIISGVVLCGSAVRWRHMWKRAAESARRNNERLGRALSATRLGVWDWEAASGRIAWSDNMRDILDFGPADLDTPYTEFLERVPPEERSALKQCFSRAVETGGQFEMEHRVQSGAGETRWLLCRGQGYVDKEGRVTRMSGTAIDITERRQMEEALRESEQRYRQLFDHSPEPIVVHSEGKIVKVNKAGVRIAGALSEEDLIGEPVLQFVHPDERVATEEVMWKNYEAKQEDVTPLLLTKAVMMNGATLDIEGKRLPIMYEGKPATIVVMHDVTRHKRYERELIRAREKAEEMNRLKTAFLANMSHEIRTPLTSIIGFAEILSDDASDEQREIIRYITKNGERLMGTLTSVLDLAQLESGTLKMSLQPVDVVEAARETVDLFRLRAEKQGLRVRLDANLQEGTCVKVDRDMLHRVLMNLVSNAIKFTPEGEVTISVRAENEREVAIRVADTGVGIDEEFLPHVFDEFTQESVGVKRHFEGSGLGMAITKRLVHLMEGTISVDSTKGQGSTFTVRLSRNL